MPRYLDFCTMAIPEAGLKWVIIDTVCLFAFILSAGASSFIPGTAWYAPVVALSAAENTWPERVKTLLIEPTHGN